MISDNQTDEFLNDRLRGYQSPVPADMWDRIIEKKKRDRILWLFFFRLLIVGILALGLAGSYLIFNQKKSASTVNTENTKIKPLSSVLTTEAASVNIKIKPTSSVSSGVKLVRTNLFSGQYQTTPERMKKEEKILHQDIKTAVKNNKPAMAYSDTPVNGVDDKTDKIHSSNEAISSETHSSSGDSNKLQNSKEENKKDSLETKHLVKKAGPDSSGVKGVKQPETKKNLPNRLWFLDLYASADYPILSFNENQQSELSYTIGIKINRSLGKHLSVKTGIQYSQLNFRGGDSSGGKIHLMRWDFPFFAGYSIGKGNLKTTFNAGAVMNLNTWPSPRALSIFFKNNTGLSLYFGVNLEKRINDKFSLFGEPYYRYQLTSMSVSSVSGFKFIDVAGINIGARYYFKK